MNVTKENKAMSLPVTKDLTVTILPDLNHEFLMPTRDVAIGYGLSVTTIRRHIMEHADELMCDKHFIRGVQNLNGASLPATYWTKRGIVRLGFFIKSERAKLFRDWAEELVINKTDAPAMVSLPSKRPRSINNVLSNARLLSIMNDVCRIDDRELRLSLSNKLISGGAL